MWNHPDIKYQSSIRNNCCKFVCVIRQKSSLRTPGLGGSKMATMSSNFALTIVGWRAVWALPVKKSHLCCKPLVRAFRFAFSIASGTHSIPNTCPALYKHTIKWGNQHLEYFVITLAMEIPIVPVPQQMSSTVVFSVGAANSPIVEYRISAAGVFTLRKQSWFHFPANCEYSQIQISYCGLQQKPIILIFLCNWIFSISNLNGERKKTA